MRREEKRRALALGARAERLVCDHLEAEGWTILATNARIGRLEIDIVARRGRTLAFCEVRSRRGSRGPHPLETIDRAKRERIRRAALAWAIAKEARGCAMRFDAAAVLFDADGRATVDYRAGAF